VRRGWWAGRRSGCGAVALAATMLALPAGAWAGRASPSAEPPERGTARMQDGDGLRPDDGLRGATSRLGAGTAMRDIASPFDEDEQDAYPCADLVPRPPPSAFLEATPSPSPAAVPPGDAQAPGTHAATPPTAAPAVPAGELHDEDAAFDRLLPDEFEGYPLHHETHRGTDMADESMFATQMVRQVGGEGGDLIQGWAIGPWGDLVAMAIAVRGVGGPALLAAWLDTYGRSNLHPSPRCRWREVDGYRVLRARTDRAQVALLPVADALILVFADDRDMLGRLLGASVAHLRAEGIPPLAVAADAAAPDGP
jgi:hypothetical protein